LFIEPLSTVLKEEFDLTFHVSGSGSCCFCFIKDEADFGLVKKEIKKCLGEHTKFWISQIL
jgi:4-diphosphocytidyl-2C-methyl-D-erythritol kinase